MRLPPLALAMALATLGGAVVIRLPDGAIECGSSGPRTTQCLGVPFARAARWRRPEPPAPWRGVRPATKAGPMCLQPWCYGGAQWGGGNLTKRLTRDCSEECLLLNVWAPSRSPAPGAAGYPVVVWIHGGGFESGGSGAAWGHNGTQHVEASGGEVIWVSIAYRLNVFGFLGAAQLRARDAAGSTGNYGLQDQREALRWVQRSIGSFGGDPSRVTLDGCSAGAGSTANHATNHHSWPFFRQVAGESGMFAPWNAKPLSAAQKTFDAVAQSLGCGPGDLNATAVVDCLEGKSAQELTVAGNIGLFEHTDPNVMTMTIFAPVIDSVDVLDHPWARAQAGQHFKGPLLLGTTRDEGASFCGTAQNLTQPEFEAFALQAYPGVDMSTLLQLYSDARPPPPPAAATTAAATAGSEWWWASAKLSGDIGFHCGSRAGARWLSRTGPVFLYSFAPAGDFPSGVVGHCAQKSYVQLQQSGSALAQKMGHYWFSFAKYGDPNAAPRTMPGMIDWPRYANATDENLVFDEPEIRTERGLRKAQCERCARTASCQPPGR